VIFYDRQKQPNTQNPQQSFQQQQQSADGQGNSGSSWSPPSSNRTKTSQTSTQLPGSPTIGNNNNTVAKAGQAKHMIQSDNRSKSAGGSGTNPVASRDEFDNPMRSASNSNKPKNAVVPNNSGGNIPVSETAARLPPKMDKPLAPARSAYKNLGDLPTNSASGGGGTGYAQEVIGFEGEEISPADRRPSSTGSNEIQPMDLNSYLPGGANDHRRRLLMGEVLSTGEIHNRTVDLFRRITIRMSEFCANGELLDCR
jgi:hypothetical protein